MTRTTVTRIISASLLALVASPALAVITWNPAPNSTLFQDDNLDFALEIDINDPNYDAADPSTWTLIPDTDDTLDVGDVLIAVVEFGTAAGVDIGPNEELTGVTVIEAASINQDGTIDFQPYQGGFNAATGLNVTDGGIGEGAMLAIWLDDQFVDLEIDAGFVPGNLSCSTLDQCIAQASNGDIWEVDGFGADATNNYWTALGTGVTYSAILNDSTAQISGILNAGLDILENSTGKGLQLLSFAGNNGPVDVLFNGTINGGGGSPQDDPNGDLASLIADGYKATSDSDLVKRVPAPATLALLGTGLLGFGFARRRQA